MPISVSCTCGKKLMAPDEAAGQRVRCPACNEIIGVPGKVVLPVLPGSQGAGLAEPQAPPERPYLVEVGSAFAYPLTGTGLAILAGIAVCRVIAMFLPFAGLVVMMLVGLYLSAYFFSIIQSSAGGATRQPSLPDVTDLWDDLLRPIFMMFAAAVVSAIPMLVYVLWASNAHAKPDPVVLGILSGWASLYFPMAILALAMWGSIAALSPHVVIPAIVRIPGPYLLLAVFVWAVWNGQAWVERQIGDNLLGNFVSFIVFVYLTWVIARAIGITHWCYRKRLGWFERA